MLKDFFVGLLFIVLLLITATVLVTGISAGASYISYINWQANESITLDGTLVYEGAGRNVGFLQLGEVGNRYIYMVKQYKNGFWNKFFGKVDKAWVGSDLEVKNF